MWNFYWRTIERLHFEAEISCRERRGRPISDLRLRRSGNRLPGSVASRRVQVLGQGWRATFFEKSQRVLRRISAGGISGGNFPLSNDKVLQKKVASDCGGFAVSALLKHVWRHKVHTGRELALMRAGAKPLAAFSDVNLSLHGLYVIPEREFEPHVAAGRIIERQHIDPPAKGAPVVRGQRIGMRRVLYALPGEQWRIDAYLLLWKTAEKSGWNEGFERLEGALLGYEDWENDYHIEHFFRKGKESDSVA